MSDKEIDRLIQTMRRLAEENDTPEKARRQLQDEGLLDAEGNLAEPYRS